MSNPWEQLLAVQEVDTTIQQLDHRDRQLPQRAVLADIESELSAARAEVDEAEAAKHELVRAQKALEDEIASLQAKIDAENEKLYAGGSSDPSELQTLQEEIESIRRRITRLEDDELELMEQVEPIDARLAQLAETIAGLDEKAVAATTELAEAEAAIAADRDVALAQRVALTADIDPDALARYETVRDRLGGTAVARLEPGGVCGACRMKLSAVEHDRIQHEPIDAEVQCEDCGRFLVRS